MRCIGKPIAWPLRSFGQSAMVARLETGGEGKEIEDEKDFDCVSDTRSMDGSTGQ